MLTGTIILISILVAILAGVLVAIYFAGKNGFGLNSEEREFLITSSKFNLRINLARFGVPLPSNEGETATDGPLTADEPFVAPWWFLILYPLEILFSMALVLSPLILSIIYQDNIVYGIYRVLYAIPSDIPLSFATDGPAFALFGVLIALMLIIGVLIATLIDPLYKSRIGMRYVAWQSLVMSGIMKNPRGLGFWKMRTYFSKSQINAKLDELKLVSHTKIFLWMSAILLIISSPFVVWIFNSVRLISR